MNDKERIEYIIKQLGMTNVDFAARAGIAPATLSHITSGRSKPTLTILRGIITGFPELSPEWILMGTGSLYKDAPKFEIENTATEEPTSSEVETDLFSSLEFQAQPRPRAEQVKAPKVSTSIEEIVRTTVSAMTPVVKTPQRKIVEIRIFFDDGTYQQFN